MKLFTKISPMKKWVKNQKRDGKMIGFVPTMGYLHEGHLSLIEKAKKENDVVILSIFVNPLQFGKGEDFELYPKDFERDFVLAKETGIDAVFYPENEEMYPTEMSATIVVHEGTNVLCGAKRPNHFDGVATVVLKLFHIMDPDRAYFGLKDAQQVAVIKRMVQDFHMDIEIVPCPTLRERDGLAKSSRNVNLTKEERKEAPSIFQVLQETKDFITTKGSTSSQEVEEFLRSSLSKKINGKVDYGEVLSFPQLKKQDFLSGEIIIAVAVKYSKARLIDNIIISV
ncbi:pantoate--beta-alanine ligase [Evansella tamaricis]|uniref:Pantothenate synthetase n=1 Tax=Evansella tamaricis TaxID=2069301 RepID=A0ABS6JN53_9BACI|nr:pantoate--beta-alanine ligase [Evansella tamaricis]MBU9714624.1 pantoate--beta-alanine ligase [Evansella tamaricis]